MKQFIRLAGILLFFSFSQACKPGGSSNELFLGEEKLTGGLKFSDPVEFIYEVSEKESGEYALEMEITYDNEAMNGQEALPLYYQIVMPDSVELDERVSVKVKENGEWKGTLSEDNVHRSLKHSINPSLQLAPGEHRFRLFADTGIRKPLFAVTHIIFRVSKQKKP